MRAKPEALIRQLENYGYRCQTFSVVNNGHYDADDADWNYKDVPHLNIVHTKVRAIIGAMNDDVIATLNLQKIAGIAWPVTLVNYATADNAQTYYTTLGPFVLVVHTVYERVEYNRAKVTTTYNIAAKGIFNLFFPLLKRILSKNYETLMSEDIPMRNRRGILRDRGFRFHSDGRSRSFTETTDLQVANVVVPDRDGTQRLAVPLSDLAQDGATVFIGEDDDRGARLVRRANEILVLPRLCPHEGASLDSSAVKNSRVFCPWHNRAFTALAKIDIGTAGAPMSSNSAIATVENGTIFVQVPSGCGAPAACIKGSVDAAATTFNGGT